MCLNMPKMNINNNSVCYHIKHNKDESRSNIECKHVEILYNNTNKAMPLHIPNWVQINQKKTLMHECVRVCDCCALFVFILHILLQEPSSRN